MSEEINRHFLLILAVLLLSSAEGKKSVGQELLWPYNGAHASAEAWMRSDFRRRNEIAMRIATIEQMKWRGDFHADIWGYPWFDYVEQPIGRTRIQTGPHRWESHPIYPGPYLAPAPSTLPIRSHVESTGPREF